MKKTVSWISCSILALGALVSLSAQDAPSTVAVTKGVAVVGSEKIPVFPGVNEVSATVGADNAVSVSYEAVKATESKIQKFYVGKRLFGTKVPKFKDSKNGGPIASACKKGKGVVITLDSSAKPDTVFVSISSTCAQ